MNKQFELDLPMDIRELSFFDGDISILNKKSVDEINTAFFFHLPPGRNYWQENIWIDYEGVNVLVNNFEVKVSKDDILFKYSEDKKIGVNSKHVDMLPLTATLDNRGEYPYWVSEVIIEKKIAYFSDPNHPSGIKCKETMEEKILGDHKTDKDKLFALKVWNMANQKLDKANRNFILKENNVTAFLHNFMDKTTKKSFCIGVKSLVGKDAYKNVIRDYYLDNNLIKLIEEEKTLDKEITSEEELFDIVKETLIDVLKHNVENRRWTEAFWDGERKIELNGEKIKIPAHPKGETKIQPTLQIFLQELFYKKGILLTKESDEGIGFLDFKCTYVSDKREIFNTPIEFKLAHHKRVKHGLKNQLPAYLKAMKSKYGIFLVFWFKDEKSNYFDEPKTGTFEEAQKYFSKLSEEVSENKGRHIETIFIDASIKTSASKI